MPKIEIIYNAQESEIIETDDSMNLPQIKHDVTAAVEAKGHKGHYRWALITDREIAERDQLKAVEAAKLAAAVEKAESETIEAESETKPESD